jgi:hypothetical protein
MRSGTVQAVDIRMIELKSAWLMPWGTERELAAVFRSGSPSLVDGAEPADARPRMTTATTRRVRTAALMTPASARLGEGVVVIYGSRLLRGTD